MQGHAARFLFCLALAGPAYPEPASHPGLAGFYGRGAEGWFWYRRAPKPPEPEAIPVPPPAPAPEPRPAVEPPPPDGPEPLSAAWLRTHLQDYLDAATDAPTQENVAVYLYLQRLAMDKASRFADASQRVVMKDPGLDEVTRRPTAPFATTAVNRQAGAAREALLRRVAERVGVLFFFRSACPYCEAQAPVLEMLGHRFGFTIRPVSIDGLPLTGGAFPHYQGDRGQAEQLGVVTTSALFLVRAPDAIVPIGQGLLSLAQLEDRLALAALEAGFIRDDEFQSTRPRTANLPMADALPSDLPKDPQALLAVLRQLSAARAAPPPALETP
jgi:conjugal transfer pilus assembly protein TraF